jgi:hypothetical protein
MLDEKFAELMVNSYQRIVGRSLIDEDAGKRSPAQFLYYDAPFCLLAHNGDEDPQFIYANVTAQKRFGYSWDEFMRLPSRLSAGEPDRNERQRLLEAVKLRGFIDDYCGVRIAQSGQRFWIDGVVVWELLDPAGVRHGQAAMFRRWRDLQELP